MSSEKPSQRKSKRSTKPTAKASSKPKKLKGLGDVIETITKATGIKSLIGDCSGCEKRKEKLNQLYPFYKDCKMNAMTAELYEAHREMAKVALEKGSINTTNQRPLVQVFNEVFQPSPRQKVVTCPKCWGEIERIILQLEQAYIVYKNESKK